MADPKRECAVGFVANFAATYGPQLHRYISKRLRAGEDAQDLAQEVYLRLLKHRTELIREPLAYVYTVASRVVGEQHLRSDSRIVFDSELLDIVAESTAEPDAEAWAREHARRELRRLLAKL